MNIQKSWKSLLRDYHYPTILKDKLIRPYFSRKDLSDPILDVGCGTGYFSELFALKKKEVIGIDIHKNIPEKIDFKYYTMNGAKLDFPDNHFGSVLIINVLSCIDDDKERIKILSEAKRVKKSKAKIYLLSMAENLIEKPINDELLTTKKLDENHILLSFKKIDNKRIDIKDIVISDEELKKYLKIAGLRIVKEVSFVYKKINREIYHMWILE